MPAAEYVERQITITVVITVEEPALLLPMQRIIRGIEIENDLRGRLLCASRKTSTNRLSTAAGSELTL